MCQITETGDKPVIKRGRGRPRLSDDERKRREDERLERLQKNKERRERLREEKKEQQEQQEETGKKEPKKRGRKFKPDKLTPTERAREYRKNPEYREKHKAYCKQYNDKIRAMREYCVVNNVPL